MAKLEKAILHLRMNGFQKNTAHWPIFDEWERRIERCWTSERRDHVTRHVAVGRYFYPEFHYYLMSLRIIIRSHANGASTAVFMITTLV